MHREGVGYCGRGMGGRGRRDAARDEGQLHGERDRQPEEARTSDPPHPPLDRCDERGGRIIPPSTLLSRRGVREDPPLTIVRSLSARGGRTSDAGPISRLRWPRNQTPEPPSPDGPTMHLRPCSGAGMFKGSERCNHGSERCNRAARQAHISERPETFIRGRWVVQGLSAILTSSSFLGLVAVQGQSD